MDPVGPVQESGVDNDSLEGSVPGQSQFTADIPEHTANMNEGDARSGLSWSDSRVHTEVTHSVPSTAKVSSDEEPCNQGIHKHPER
jgi:hypothetical protein